MRVNEIFYGLQGEGIYTGVPMVFVRLQGCSLGCSYCDTARAQDPQGGKVDDIEGVFSRVRMLSPYLHSWVCITGGEPLEQPKELGELVRKLKGEGYKVTIETNGTFRKPYWWELVDSWNADIKCPSSGQGGKSLESDWFITRPEDQVKFVVGNQEDLDFAKEIIGWWVNSPTVLVSPTWDARGVWPKLVAEFCLQERVRFSYQIHKAVGIR